MKKNLKMLIVITMLIIVAVTTTIFVMARVGQEAIIANFNNIQIILNGEQIQTPYEPFIYNERTYLPVRAVAEALGLHVDWDEETSTVILTSLNEAIEQGQYIPTQQQTPPPTTNQSNNQQESNNQGGGRPSTPAISMERAIEIAYTDLANRGISASFRTHSGMDFERGQWVWELEFRGSGNIIEYYINVNTGAIVKFEMERDD